jgi:hypothetical protein
VTSPVEYPHFFRIRRLGSIKVKVDIGRSYRL